MREEPFLPHPGFSDDVHSSSLYSVGTGDYIFSNRVFS